MSLTFNTKTFVGDTPRSADIYRYLGPDHAVGKNDFVDLSRTAPKPIVGYSGNQRSGAKLTRTVTDGTVVLKDAIIKTESSIPADIDAVELAALIADYQAMIAATLWADLINYRKINQ